MANLVTIGLSNYKSAPYRYMQPFSHIRIVIDYLTINPKRFSYYTNCFGLKNTTTIFDAKPFVYKIVQKRCNHKRKTTLLVKRAI